jgi:hypothetical protein
MEENPINIVDFVEPIKNQNLDQLTLELFMNKKNYKKYIEKADPKKHSEIQSHHLDLVKYRGSIVAMTDDLLENPNLQITTEINDIFDAYTKTIIRHLKNKELERQTNYGNQEHEQELDDDVMFGQMNEEAGQEPMDSFWGGERVVKKQPKKSFFQKDISRFGIPRTNIDL